MFHELSLYLSQTNFVSFYNFSRYARSTHARPGWIRLMEINANYYHAAAHYHHSKHDHDNAVKTRKDWGIECGRLAYASSLIHAVSTQSLVCLSDAPISRLI